MSFPVLRLRRAAAMAAIPTLLVAAALAAPVPAAAPAFAQEVGPDPAVVEALPHDEALKLLGGALRDSVTAAQSDPSIPEILAALDRNIAATRRIRGLAGGEGAVIDEQTMQDIAAEVSTIARSFRQIAELAPDVFRRRLQELGTIEAVGEQVGFRMADARSRLAELAEDNQRIQNALRSQQLRQSEIEKLRLTQQANNAETHSLEAAIEAWGFFGDRHDQIMDRMADQSEDLDVFFHALRENARVYEAAAQTLNLANSLKLALSELESEVQNLDAMRSSLVQSWGDLMRIVDEVNEGLLLQPGI